MKLGTCLCLLTCSALFGLACSDDAKTDGGGGGNEDATATTDSAPRDATTMTDGGTPADAESSDAIVGNDATIGMDAEPVDSGTMLAPGLEPGMYVQVAEGRVSIGDTFDEVTSAIGAGTRSAAANTRSYEWALSGGVNLVVWFANVDLHAPGDEVRGTDKVLWIAVNGSFTGKTSQNVGIGTARMDVESGTGYGPPQHTVALTNPAGTLAQYFTTGILIAYDTGDVTRTITISRAYTQEPDGDIDFANAQLDFGAGNVVQGFRGIGMSGTAHADVVSSLGEPDGEGQVTIGGATFLGLSYGFIGIEVFIGNATDLVYFTSVHAPYYGLLPTNGAGIGSTRTEIEAGLGLGMGMASSTSANLICYENNPDVAVTYSTDATPVATTITIPLLACP